MWFEMRNTETFVSRMDDVEAAWLHNYLTLPEKRGPFGPQARPVTLYDLRTQSFPAGLTDLVIRAGRKDGFTIDVRDHRGPWPAHDPKADLAWLYDHQHEALEAVFTHKRGIIQSPTASGKGDTLCGLVKMYPGAPCVVLVNSKDLVDDLVERLTKHLGEPIGQWGRGKRDLRRVTVCMAPSLAKALRTKAQKKFFESAQVLIIDEVHGAGSATMYQSAQAFTHAPIRVGFSATPFDRGDERSLMVAGCTGEVIHRVRFDDMVDKGVIAKPVIHAHRFPLTPVAIRQKGPLSAAWHHGYHDTMLSPTRMAAVKQLVLAAEKPCLVLLESLEHGAAVAKMLNLAGVTCEFASGELKDADRARLKREITHGDRQVVVANRIFKTGIDIPELRSVVSVGAGKAVIANIQSVGRGARRRDKQGAVVKDSFSFHDLADRDCGCRHMDRGAARYDHTACKWFDRHARARMAAYRTAGFEIKECIE